MENSIVRIITLGGQDENHKKMTLVEIDGDIFVINAGIKEPDRKNMPGIDFIIAKHDYLIQHKDRVKAYILTHAYDSCIAGVPYIYKKVPAPIYCTNCVMHMLSNFCKHNKINIEFDYMVQEPTSEFYIAKRKINFFSLCSNMTESVGVAIETPLGNVIYLESFVIDNNFDTNYVYDAKTLGALAEKPTLALLVESRYAERGGYTNPKYKLSDLVRSDMRTSLGRVFAAIETPDSYNIEKVCELAIKDNRKIVCYDKQTEEVFRTLWDVHSKTPIDKVMLNIADINRVPPEEVFVLMLGWNTRLYKKIIELASNTNFDKRIQINSKDTFILGVPYYTETEVISSDALNELYRTDCKIVTFKKDQFLRCHASQEDIKTVIALLRPKYYFPINGYFKTLLANAHLAVGMGVGLNYSNVFILDNGNAVEIDSRSAKLVNLTVGGDVLIDGKFFGHVDETTLADRQVFSDDGVVVIGLIASRHKGKVVAGPDIQMRGFMLAKDVENINKEINKICDSVVANHASNLDRNTIESEISDLTFKTIRRYTQKTPVIMVIASILD